MTEGYPFIHTAPSIAEALAAATDTRQVIVGRGILTQAPALFREVCPGSEAILIADCNTFAAAGHAVQMALEASGVKTRPLFIIDDPDLYAEMRFVEMVESALKNHDAIPIAVGSGTLNDLTKLAAHRHGRSSVCIATAASMDGYTAYGSSITHRGSKQTFDCPAPLAVLADLDIIAAAPSEMGGWGYADMSAKITAGADWILADALGVEPIEPKAWHIAQGSLWRALGDSAGVGNGEPDAMRGLVEGLILGGFAMQSSRSSRPASGAEHQFSHLWDMQHHTHQGKAPSHGAKVGIATLAITALYESLLTIDLQALDIDGCAARWPDLNEWMKLAEQRFQQPELLAVAAREMEAKYSPPEVVRAQLAALQSNWSDLRLRLQSQLLPFEKLMQQLLNAGAPTEPEHIGITRERLRDTFLSAFFVRRRFTVLDVAVRAGVLESCLEEIFGPNGRWPESRSPEPT